MLILALSVLLHLSNLRIGVGAFGASCGCTSINLPIRVDVLVPKDPTDVFAGLKSERSALRRVNDTYNIYGVLCEPNDMKNADTLQLLVHGFSYTSEYWSPPIEELRNYSYASFACEQGLPSFAIDLMGSGLSSRPANASDVQYPSSAAVLSQLAHHLKKVPLLPTGTSFRKIIGIGHSLGSALLTFSAIVDGANSPFDGLVLTSMLTVDPTAPPPGSGFPAPSGRDVDPARWGALDPGYVTSVDRTQFYPVDTSTFSPRMLEFDGFVKDVGSIDLFFQAATTSILAESYSGGVAKMVGSQDQVVCAGGRCKDSAALASAEGILWPAARSFELVVSQGSGHDLNLDFFAAEVFNTLVRLVEKVSA